MTAYATYTQGHHARDFDAEEEVSNQLYGDTAPYPPAAGLDASGMETQVDASADLLP